MTFVRSRSLFCAAFHAGLAAAAFVAAAVAVAPAVYGQAPADNTLTAAEQSAGWQLLFDGKTIDKWRGYNTKEIPASWSIVDGAITAAKGKGADLVSADEYGDFELAVDFKVAKNGNSGIFYRGVESPTGADLPQRARVPGPRRRRPPRCQERPGSLLRRQLRRRPAARARPATRPASGTPPRSWPGARTSSTG